MNQKTDLISGMLYIVSVRLVHAQTMETHKHKILIVGCEQKDIERKLRWIFDPLTYKQFSVSEIEKVREKVHFLSTVVTQQADPKGPAIERREGTQVAVQASTLAEVYDPRLYAIGITTTMLARDEEHALRKVGNALIARTSAGKSNSAASLSADSQVSIEQVPLKSGFAKARDTSAEVNRAHFVRG